jgi:hypothetical protein
MKGRRGEKENGGMKMERILHTKNSDVRYKDKSREYAEKSKHQSESCT